MRVVEPHQFKGVKDPRQNKKRYGVLALVLLAAFMILAVVAEPYVHVTHSSAVQATHTDKPQTQSTAQQTAQSVHVTPLKTFKYCVGVRGVSDAELPAFSQKIDFALNSNRGWSLGNKVLFKKVDAGCDFTVWLSSPDNMATFGGNCDSQWSCRSGNAVVANYEKWQDASPAWKQAGGSIDFYRVMVINHETGHWLGFEHRHCGGPGQLAPVMQQQSVDLEGCRFSPWPNSDELMTLKKQLNL